MKVRAAPATGSPVPQFIIEAECADDRVLLHVFATFPQHGGAMRLHLHGYTVGSECNGVKAFNFGWMAESEFRRPSRLRRAFASFLRRPTNQSQPAGAAGDKE
jgi:hypothetical protein